MIDDPEEEEFKPRPIHETQTVWEGLGQTKPCPKCGKKMIVHRTGVQYPSYPVQHQTEWWCGCGHKENGPTLRDSTDEELTRERWERVN